MDTALTSTLMINACVFTGIWLIHVSREDAGVIDFFWGPVFVLIGTVTFVSEGHLTLYHLLFMAAVSLWAVRLTAHLCQRHLASDSEDGRYRTMREAGGASYWWVSLFKVFLLQALILWLVAAPVHVAMRAPAETVWIGGFVIGLIIFLAGFGLEALADKQLAAQHSQNREHIVAGGLWAYSRHPNYVGEIVLWWGLGLSAFAISGNWMAFLGPVLLSTIIRYVSIPLTEEWLVRSRPKYSGYQSDVPLLIPYPLANKTSAKEPAE